VTLSPRLVKKALVVGIDRYKDKRLMLRSAIHDSDAVARKLATHWNPDLGQNWSVDVWNEQRFPKIEREPLEEAIEAFLAPPEQAGVQFDLLLYFSGHATIKGQNVYLRAYDGNVTSFTNLMNNVSGTHKQGVRSVTLILDCCFSGDLGDDHGRDPFGLGPHSVLPSNVSILTASTPSQRAKEDGNHGYFTRHLVAGLDGGAADLIGEVTPTGLYSHVRRAMSGFEHQPVFKSYSHHQPVLRRTEPQIPLERLIEIGTYFKDTDTIQLTEFHEGLPEFLELPNGTKERNPRWHVGDDAGSIKRGKGRAEFTGSEKQIELDHLKLFRNAHLLVTDDGRDFWFVCMEPPLSPAERDTVSLTPLGRYYRDLALAGSLRGSDEYVVEDEIGS
jgi:hypothetical protein